VTATIAESHETSGADADAVVPESELLDTAAAKHGTAWAHIKARIFKEEHESLKARRQAQEEARQTSVVAKRVRAAEAKMRKAEDKAEAAAEELKRFAERDGRKELKATTKQHDDVEGIKHDGKKRRQALLALKKAGNRYKLARTGGAQAARARKKMASLERSYHKKGEYDGKRAKTYQKLADRFAKKAKSDLQAQHIAAAKLLAATKKGKKEAATMKREGQAIKDAKTDIVNLSNSIAHQGKDAKVEQQLAAKYHAKKMQELKEGAQQHSIATARGIKRTRFGRAAERAEEQAAKQRAAEGKVEEAREAAEQAAKKIAQGDDQD